MMQLIQIFAMDGWKLDERVIHSEAEYLQYLSETLELYGDDFYPICTDNQKIK